MAARGISLCACALLLSGASAALAQYPAKPVHISGAKVD
jgi:hypothetical protein